LVEALVGLLFLGAYCVDVIAGPKGDWGQVPAWQMLAAAYHAIFLALLVAATFIDYDLMIIPDQITVTGVALGLGLGTIWPLVRPAPASWAGMTHLQGFGAGLLGLVVGAGLTYFVRASAGRILRREAMGLGDVTLMAMIGSFLGWQAAVITFFLAPFLGLGHAAWRLLSYVKKRIMGDECSGTDREIPYGPYLSMAAAALVFVWPWLWRAWAAEQFHTLYVIFWWILGFDFP
jgi:leader peptidase (prepilin peptidase)/N-methyltransferase